MSSLLNPTPFQFEETGSAMISYTYPWKQPQHKGRPVKIWPIKLLWLVNSDIQTTMVLHIMLLLLFILPPKTEKKWAPLCVVFTDYLLIEAD